MTVFLRLLVLLSIAALVASVMIPLQSPYQFTVEMGNPPVALLALAAALLLLVTLFPIAAYGLLRLRPWSAVVAACVALVLCALSAAAVHPSGLGTSLSSTGKAALVVAAASWLIAVIVALLPTVRSRFTDGR